MNPQIEEPKEPKEEPKENTAEALLSELEKAGYTDPEKLQGALNASKEVGNMARHLGDTRNENEQLKQELMSLRQAIENRAPEPEGDSIDLKSLVANSVRSEIKDFYINEVVKPQQEAQERFHRELAQVTQDQDYPLVADAFQKHLYSPNVQANLVSGKTTVEKEYNKTVRAALRTMLGKSAGALKELTGTTPAPHVESGQQPPAPKSGAIQETLANLEKAHREGRLSSAQLAEAKVKASLFGDPDGPKG